VEGKLAYNSNFSGFVVLEGEYGGKRVTTASKKKEKQKKSSELGDSPFGQKNEKKKVIRRIDNWCPPPALSRKEKR